VEQQCAEPREVDPVFNLAGRDEIVASVALLAVAATCRYVVRRATGQYSRIHLAPNVVSETHVVPPSVMQRSTSRGRRSIDQLSYVIGHSAEGSTARAEPPSIDP
jgi:hypothetical protein